MEAVFIMQHTPRRLLGTELSMPPDSGNRTHDTYISQTTFDTSMLIILAALLCALVVALGLNSIVRCLMRCSGRFAWDGQERAAARLAARGLKKRDLRQLPVVVFGSSSDVDTPATECPICLGEFEEGDKVRVLPRCHHGFHVKCIDTWLVSHSSCPNCRLSLLDRPTGSVRVQEGARRTRPQENYEPAAPAVVVANEHGGVEVVVDERSS